jgi:hypothetical protein
MTRGRSRPIHTLSREEIEERELEEARKYDLQ